MATYLELKQVGLLQALLEDNGIDAIVWPITYGNGRPGCTVQLDLKAIKTLAAALARTAQNPRQHERTNDTEPWQPGE